MNDEKKEMKPEEREMIKRQKKIIKRECFECGYKNTTCSETEMYCENCGGYFVI